MPFNFHANRPAGERKLVSRYMKLAQHEPRLLTLLTDIMAAQPTSRDWYRQDWKERVCKLVGFDRSEHPVLGTSEAYDTVYELCFSYCYDGEAK